MKFNRVFGTGVFAATAAAMMCSAGSSFAADATPTTIATNATSSGVAGVAPNDDPFYRRAVFTEYIPPPQPRMKIIGAQFDVGAPDGVALGFSVKPGVRWLRLNVAGTYNALSGGIRFGATFDPIRYWIGPSATIEGGYAWPGNVPGVSKSPEVSYSYTNLHLGVEFGNRDSVRFFIHAGWTYMNIATSNFERTVGNTPSGVAVSDPSVQGWLAPSAKLGLVVFF